MAHASLKLVLLATYLTMAASLHAQEKTSRKIAGWGELVDPKGDCKATEKKGTVTITVPGGHHNLNPLPEYNLLAPRLLQPVEGDFQVQVYVVAFPKPKAKTSATRDGVSYIASGLVIWQDDKNFLRCMRASHGERDEVFIHTEGFQKGLRAPSRFYIRAVKERVIPDNAIWFRVERRGNDLTSYHSADGKKWVLFSRFTIAGLAKKLSVGVAAVNTTKNDFNPQFTDLKVTRGK